MNGVSSGFLRGIALASLLLLLSLCGIFTIFNGSGTWGSPLEPTFRQLFCIALGYGAFFAARRMPSDFFFGRRTIWITAAVGWFFVALLAVWGSRIHGMRGWYRYGVWSVQPVDIVKGVYLAVLCAVLSQKSERRFAAAFAFAALWIAPILFQPDFSTAMIHLGILVALAFLAGCRWRYAVAMLAFSCATGALFIGMKPYAWRRIAAFFSPDSLQSNWHMMQFEMTLARGGWFGAHPGRAVWSNHYLPFAYNDSAYATLSETLGFCGALVVWGLFIAVVALLLHEAKAPGRDAFARLYAEGTAIWIAFQALIHASVNLTLLPPTGLTLPFVSFGGSSIVGFFLMAGWAMASGNDARNGPCGSGKNERDEK